MNEIVQEIQADPLASTAMELEKILGRQADRHELTRAETIGPPVWAIESQFLHKDDATIANWRRVALMCAAALNDERDQVRMLLHHARCGRHWVVHRLLAQFPHAGHLANLYGIEPEYTLTPEEAEDRVLPVGQIPGVSQSPNFTDDEWSSDDRGVVYLQPITPLAAQHLRSQTGGRPWDMTSGYRTIAHNRAEGGVPDSWHLTGLAFDLLTSKRSGADALRLMSEAKKLSAKGLTEVIPYANRGFAHFAFEPTPQSKKRDRGIAFDKSAPPAPRITPQDPQVAARSKVRTNGTAGVVLTGGGLAVGPILDEALSYQQTLTPLMATGGGVVVVIGLVMLIAHGRQWWTMARQWAASWGS